MKKASYTCDFCGLMISHEHDVNFIDIVPARTNTLPPDFPIQHACNPCITKVLKLAEKKSKLWTGSGVVPIVAHKETGSRCKQCECLTIEGMCVGCDWPESDCNCTENCVMHPKV